MGKKALYYGAALIGLYIAVAKTSNTGAVISAGAQGVSGITKTLQGRG